MRVVVLLLVFMIGRAEAQLYLSESRTLDNYAELFKDSARVEVFKTHCHHWCSTYYLYNELLLPKNSGDTLFSGTLTHILKKHGSIILCYKSRKKNKYTKVELAKSTRDKRDTLRKFAYTYYRTQKLFRLKDSLSGPNYPIILGSSIPGPRFDPNYYLFKQFAGVLDRYMDSLSAVIIESRDKRIDSCYKLINSIRSLDSATIFDLLAKTNYDFFYGKYLLKQLAKHRPELLVQYVDKNSSNKKTILCSIRDHDDFKEITRNVELCKARSYGKKQIVRQRSNRVGRDVGFGAAYVGLVLAEVSLIVLLIVVVTR